MTYEVIGAMVCITILEVYALSEGINGVLLTTVIGALAGLAGYQIRIAVDYKRGKQ